MVCRQLGFAGGALSAITSAGFGPGSGKILMDNVDCHGNERRLKLCNHVGWGKHVCNHGEMQAFYVSQVTGKYPLQCNSLFIKCYNIVRVLALYKSY